LSSVRNGGEELVQRRQPVERIRARTEEHRQLTIDCTYSRLSTGSVVGEDEDNLYILTCAHVLGPVFNSRYPIHADTVNHIYEVYIVCDHCEEMFRRHSKIKHTGHYPCGVIAIPSVAEDN
jgi:hypothetical protein